MANEAVVTWGTAVTLTSAGSSFNNNAMTSASASAYTTAETNLYPNALFTFQTTGFGSTATAMSNIDLHFRLNDMPVGSTSADAEAPSTGYQFRYGGSFIVRASSAGQTLWCESFDIPRSAFVYLYSNAGQAVGAYILTMQPFTYGTSA